MTIIINIIDDAIAIIVAYVLNFIVCDLIYNHFNISLALKGAYWFILGPLLYAWGSTVPWIEAWLKVLFNEGKEKLMGKLEQWWKKIDPFGFVAYPIKMIDTELFSPKSLKVQKEFLSIKKKQYFDYTKGF